MIDWYERIGNYNKKHDSDYDSEHELIIDLYSEYKNINSVADQLKCSAATIRKKMIELNIERNPKGWPIISPVLKQIIGHRRDHFKSMTVSEIATSLSCSKNQIYNIFGKYGYRFKARKTQGPGD